MKQPADYEVSVFINCPFDDDYKPLFDAIVFAVQIAGFKPRCALEASNAAQARIDKIMAIVSECQYSVHDLSRTELSANGLPRFNMPLELGLDLGCRQFGNQHQRKKRLLVMDRTAFRYQKFISDIAGQDIQPHGKSSRRVITNVRDWISTESMNSNIAGGEYMAKRYAQFRRDLPPLCRSQRKAVAELTFGDISALIRVWLEENEV